MRLTSAEQAVIRSALREAEFIASDTHGIELVEQAIAILEADRYIGGPFAGERVPGYLTGLTIEGHMGLDYERNADGRMVFVRDTR